MLIRVLASLALLTTPALAQTCPAPVGVPAGPWDSLFLAPDSHGGPLFFIGGQNASTGRELWRWDAVGGVVQLTDEFMTLDGANGAPEVLWVKGARRAFFSGRSGSTGYEPFVSDGTPAGTVLLKDVKAGTSSSNPREFVAAGGTVYFSAETPTARLLLKTDGTTSGTTLVKGVAAGGPIGPERLAAFGDRLLLSGGDGANGHEPWISDGTLAGTVALGDLNPGPDGSAPWDFTPLGDVAVFSAETEALGRELFVTDGTPGGTALLMDLNPGLADGLSPFAEQGFVAWRGEVYFGASDGVHGFELWKTNGTPAGTQLVLDLTPGAASSSLGGLVAGGDVLYFANDTSDALGGVWALGVGGALAQVGTVEPEFVFSGFEQLVPADGGVYYAGRTAATGAELFFASMSGTALVCDLAAGAASGSAVNPQVIGDRLVFGANDGVGVQPYALPLAGGHATDLGFGGGALVLSVGVPTLGAGAFVRVEGKAPGDVGFVAFSAIAEPSAALVEAGAALWLDPLTAQLAATFTAPSFETTYALPNDPSLAGARVHAQAFALGVSGLPLAASNGVVLGL